MMKSGVLLVTSILLFVASGFARANDTSVLKPAELPSWTSQTQFREPGGKRMVFVGIGQGDSIAQAKARARSDAQAQYLLAVGGVVITSQKLVESTQTDEDGIAQYSVSGKRYTESVSQSFLQGGDSEFVAHSSCNAVSGYFRLSLPIESVEAARDELSRAHREEVLRKIEAYRLAALSRRNGVKGYHYAVVQEQASAQRESNELRISVEHEARRKARHTGRVSLVNRLKGASIRAVSAKSGQQVDMSYSSVTGFVRSEVVAERVWWEGEEAVAESFLLGWVKGADL
ncbi:MAG: hypothetical protein COA80_16930 [Leeuwenhoekiella sp.]|nr:MAG: hypothetical protein COA80_16930 [Leeuwenhoekiella sp.]